MKKRSLLKTVAVSVMFPVFAGLFASCPDPYQPSIRSIRFAQETLEIIKNEGELLQIIVSPSSANMKDVSLTWTSSNPSAATVDNQGNVEGVSQGDTVITAVVDGSDNAVATCVVKVYDYIYTVTFDNNGGNTEAVPRIKKVYSPKDKIDELPTASPVRSGHEFAGWYTIADDTAKTETPFTASTIITSFKEPDITVYAKWKAAKPTATPPDGAEVEDNTPVTLATATSDATIRYTLDGTDPTKDSTLYSDSTKPVIKTGNLTLKAIAIKEGVTNSDILTATYTIVAAGTVTKPFATPAAGTVTSGTTVTLNTATPGAKIYYTQDGKDPTKDSTLYSDSNKPVIETGKLTLKAIAVKDGMTNSAILEAIYTLTASPQTVATPTANPPAGEVTSGATVELRTTTAGADIWYTTNGSTPAKDGPSSKKYTVPISITAAMTIKAIAVKDGMTPSAPLEAAYTVAAPGTVTKPTATPGAGTYTSAQNVTLDCSTQGATIHYTTDGSDPTISSPTYSGPITISVTTTLKAIAVKAGMTTSAPLVATYTIDIPSPGTVATPIATPAEGTYTSAQSVTLSCSTPGATIHYTTNGSNPTDSSPTYSGPISISVTTTLKAIAVNTGMTNSAILTATYTINIPSPGTVATPTATPAGGTYTSVQNVTLSCSTQGATIHYTTNGSDPTDSSPTYSGPIPINETTTLKAIAVNTGMTNSDVMTEIYTMKVATPTATPAGGGPFTANQSVTISCLTTGATIHYTTNGSDPTNSSPTYSGSITISVTTTLKAIAVKANMENSGMMTETYTMKVATPTATPAGGGPFTANQSVTLSCSTPGATIHYTTNGSDPTNSSPTSSGSITISETTTLKAIAVNTGMTNSDVMTEIYTMKVATPTATPEAGEVASDTEVTLSTTTQDAEIWYTIDNSTPVKDGTDSTKYTTTPITITAAMTIKAIAVKDGMTNSEILEAAYTIEE